MSRWLVLILLIPAFVQAATVEVRPGQSIQNAVNQAGSGGTTCLHTGTYAEGGIVLPDGSAGAPSTLKACGDGPATLQPNSSSVDCIICLKAGGQHDITIDGVILDGGSPSGDRLVAFDVSNDDQHNATGYNFTVQNCEIKNGRQQGMLLGGSHWAILNNHIHHNGTDNQLHHGIYFGGRDSLISGNTMDNNTCFGVQNYNSATEETNNNTYTNNISTQNGCGIVIAQGSGHTFTNNVVHHDGLRGISPAVICCGDNTTVSGNTIAYNPTAGIGPYNSNNSSVHIDNNIICGNQGGDIQANGASVGQNQTGTCPSGLDQMLAAGDVAGPGTTTASLPPGTGTPPLTTASLPSGGQSPSTPDTTQPLPQPKNLRVFSLPAASALQTSAR